MTKWIFWPLAAALAVALGGSAARANTLSAIGGLNFGRSTGLNELKKPRPVFGAEYTLDAASRLQLGAFYDYNYATSVDGGSGAIQYRGVLARLALRPGFVSGPFVDAKAGLAQWSQGDVTNSPNRLAFGGGVGYRFVVGSHFSVSPRVGVRSLPDSAASTAGSQPLYDASLMFSFKF